MTKKQTNRLDLCTGPKCPQCGSSTTGYVRVPKSKKFDKNAFLAGIVCSNPEDPHCFEFTTYFNDILDIKVTE